MRTSTVPDSKPSRRYACKQVAQRTTEYLEDRLGRTRRAQFVRHVEACTACRTYVQQIALTRDSLRKLPGADMPERMRKALHKRLAKRAARAKAPGDSG